MKSSLLTGSRMLLCEPLDLPKRKCVKRRRAPKNAPAWRTETMFEVMAFFLAAEFPLD